MVFRSLRQRPAFLKKGRRQKLFTFFSCARARTRPYPRVTCVYMRAHGLSVRIMGLIICYNKTVESSRQPLIPGEKPRRKLPPVNHSGRPAAQPQKSLTRCFSAGVSRPAAPPGSPPPSPSSAGRAGFLFAANCRTASPLSHCIFQRSPAAFPGRAAPSGPPVGHHIAAFVAKRPGKFRIRPMPVRDRDRILCSIISIFSLLI